MLLFYAVSVASYDTLGIRRTYSQLKPPASPRGYSKSNVDAFIYMCCIGVIKNDFNALSLAVICRITIRCCYLKSEDPTIYPIN